MDGSSTTPLDEAAAALGAGNWQLASERYRRALADRASGEALFGLGIALWWLGEAEESLRSWESAYSAFRHQADHAQAVLAAFYLSLGHRMSLGNDVAANGWLERASALVAEFDLAPMEGWVELARAYTANDSDDPPAAAAHARRAIDLARSAGDIDLRLCATAELGAALVAEGNVGDGAALLDQAMAAALAGEGGELDTVVLVGCRTITACSRAADVQRAIKWIQAADDFHRRFGSTHLFTTCRTHYGAVLFAAGEWQAAEHELRMALETVRAGDAALRAEASSKLAELRLAQGRVDEARSLLAGLEDHAIATLARARLHLVDAQPTVAAALVRRRLATLGERHAERAVLLDLLAEADEDAHAASDGTEGAAADDLASAHRARTAGRRWAVGDPTAVSHLEAALACFGALEMPYECARTRVVLARALAAAGREVAVNEAQIALRSFEELGARRDADATAALLRSLGARAARSAPRSADVLTEREREVLALLAEGRSNVVIAERLFISRRTVEHHVAQVLSKLGLGGRAEAAAYVARAEKGSVAK